MIEKNRFQSLIPNILNVLCGYGGDSTYKCNIHMQNDMQNTILFILILPAIQRNFPGK